MGEPTDFVQILYKVFVGYQMTVNYTDDINCEKIKINSAASDKSVYKDGAFLGDIGEHYGGPSFDIYYSDNLIGRASTYNKNNWYTNKFEFDFYKENGKVRFKFKPYGPKSLEDCYIWVDKRKDSIYYQSYEIDGRLINTWTE